MINTKRVEFSNRLDLDRFFFRVQEQIYVIFKMNEFPNYYSGGDIDVFCYDQAGFACQILSVGNEYLEDGFEIKVVNKSETHTHIDFYYSGELEFRFDLYQSLPEYKKIQLKEHYIFSVIENAKPIIREFGDIQYPIYVPSTVDDLLLRYAEYIEWYETRPDKVKHLDYILDAVVDNSNRIGLLDKIHLYTKLPSPTNNVDSSKNISKFGSGEALIEKIRAFPFRRVPGAILRRLKRGAFALLKEK